MAALGLACPWHAVRMKPDPSRRRMLAAAASGSLLLAGCKGIAALGPVPHVGADVVALDHAIAAEELMVARYAEALSAVAGGGHLAAVLSAVHAEHQRHLAALRSRLVLPRRLATAPPKPSPTAPALPAGRHAMLAALTTAEKAAARRLRTQLAGVPAPLAQLMASIGAAEAAHVVLLAQAGRHA